LLLQRTPAQRHGRQRAPAVRAELRGGGAPGNSTANSNTLANPSTSPLNSDVLTVGFFNNANPAYNREYFNEAHDFIIQAWTRPGPWRYEGKHFHYRHVNPWALPYQKPHPPMWIPGTLSPETVEWCAAHRYPYIGLGTPLAPTCDLWDFYADEAAKHGYQAGPENFGYMVATALGETEEEAQQAATCKGSQNVGH
jgi:alkanesulfonate monooxygenase SsuD/methylene tetrahydromethanopterin reductase-like flavin-dependent oxidoreductase (luciferase family)